MSTECYPITVLPHVSQLYRDYLAMAESASDAPVRRWYGAEPFAGKWMGRGVPVEDAGRAGGCCWSEQSGGVWRGGRASKANIAKLRAGARAVVTGQQVVLFGGPLLTLLKAATAVARAKQATKATGVEHVPVFWLATEDHDLEEVDQVSLLTKTSVETLRAGLKVASMLCRWVAWCLGPEMEAVLERASELLGYAPVCELLRECYAPAGDVRADAGRGVCAVDGADVCGAGTDCDGCGGAGFSCAGCGDAAVCD